MLVFKRSFATPAAERLLLIDAVVYFEIFI